MIGRGPATRAVVAGMLLTVLAGCGVRAESSPHDVPEDHQLRTVGATSGSDASGANRIYLVEPGEEQLLRSVQRDASSADELIENLLLGPNEAEREAEYSTAIPPTLRLLSSNEQSSRLHLDVTEELTDLSGQGLVQALAQIVYTASELDEVNSVQITVRGETIAWPKANLESSTEPLSIYDYPAQVRSAQPDYPAVPSGGST